MAEAGPGPISDAGPADARARAAERAGGGKGVAGGAAASASSGGGGGRRAALHEAEAVLRRALVLEPGRADTLVELALLLKAMERREEGIELLALVCPSLVCAATALLSCSLSRPSPSLPHRAARRGPSHPPFLSRPSRPCACRQASELSPFGSTHSLLVEQESVAY